jgi:RNA polymerase sigma-70 factor (ECF subfamily)
MLAGMRLALLRGVLKVTTSLSNDLAELRVEGELTQSTAREVEWLCQNYLDQGRMLVLQLAGATFADTTGVKLLRELRGRGVMLTECSNFFTELLQEKTNQALARSSEQAVGEGLVARLKAGHEEAFETAVRQYGGQMLATARRLLGNEHDAQDAVQQAFISAFKSIESFNGNAKLSTWLHRIAVNAALMQMRSRRRRPEVPIEDLLPQFDDQGRWADQSEGLGWADEHPMDRRQTRQMVRGCIDKLPEMYRSVLLLRDIEELDTVEVAAMLGITSNATKVRLHRARQALKTLIEQETSGM